MIKSGCLGALLALLLAPFVIIGKVLAYLVKKV